MKPEKKVDPMHIMGLIKETSTLQSNVLDKKLAKYDCTPTQLRTMIFLLHFTKNGDFSAQKKLAEELNITDVAVTNLLGRMEKKELIMKTPNQSDPRYNNLTLTDKAQEILKGTKAILDETDMEILSGIQPEDLEITFNTVKKIYDKLEQMKRGQE